MAQKLATKRAKELKELRILSYMLLPNLCIECGTVISYNKRWNKYCNSSCSARYNNKIRIKTEFTKSKVSKSLKIFYSKNTYDKTNRIKNYCKIYRIVCKNCNKQVFVCNKRKYNKTCGNKDCIVQLCVGVRDYPNGNKKLNWFYNKFEDKKVLLESSWEVRIANFLTDKNIKWIRPKFIKWQDSLGKTRRYFPDFYLIDYNIYLDPKNPYCIKKDDEKLKKIQNYFKLIFGSPDIIEEWVIKNCK